MDSHPIESGFWVRSIARLKFKLFPSYEDYLAEKTRLKLIVKYWRYPDGSLVQQRKRMRLMADLHRVIRIIDAHPDNPDNLGTQAASLSAQNGLGTTPGADD